LLGGLERLVSVTYPELLPKTPQIFKLFYDADIVEEEIILAWHEKATKKFAGDKELAKKVREAAQPLIDWLK
jgi:translation initiation factor 5